MSHRQNVFDVFSAAAACGLIVLLALAATAPWPYGAVTPFGVVKLQIMAFLAAALLTLGVKRSSLGPAIVPSLLIGGVVLIGALQLVPLGDTVVRAVAPVTASIYADANRVLALFEAPPAKVRLSIAPTETVRASLLIAAYIACFVAAAAVRARVLRRLAVGTILGSAVIHVIWAATTQASLDRIHGLFVNPNHFAGYLEIALALAFGVLWTEIITGGDRLRPGDEPAGQIEKRLVPIAWRVLIWVVLAVGIALTRSRMGIAAAAVTTVLLLVAASSHSRTKRVRYAGGGILVLIAALVIVGTITGQAPLLRFLASDPRDPASDSRVRLWRLSFTAWKEFPHTGSGLGTFREAFKRVQPRDFAGLYEQAHNDALQLLVTGGWIALGLAAAGLTIMLVLLLRGWWHQRHREESALTLAAAGALFSLLLHGLAEFNFSIPAIPATLAIVLGLGWSAANYDTDAERRRGADPVVVDRASGDSG